MSLFGSGMGSAGANMITKSITSKLSVTTNREWQRCQWWNMCTDTSDKEGLSETGRPGLIPVMRSNHPDKTQLYHKILFGSSSSWDSRTPISTRNTESSTVVTTQCCEWRRSFSVRLDTTKVCWRPVNGCHRWMMCCVTLCWTGMETTLEVSSPHTLTS